MTTESSLLPQYRVRHRLIGTTALLVAAAVLLPWLLDAAPRNNDAVVQGEIRVNASDASMVLTKPVLTATQLSVAHPALSVDTSRLPASAVQPSAHVRPLSTDLHPPSAGAPQASADAVQAPGSSTQSPGSRVMQATVKSSVVAPLLAQLPGVGKPYAATKSITKNGRVSLPETAPVAREGVSSKVAAAPSVSSTQGQFAVQLGVFSHIKNVTELRQRLQENGIASYVDIMPSGARRVRCGPFKTRGEAVNRLASLRLLDVTASIVSTGR
ncbi:MAG: SPOR domain-containing protein [Betaproteobacteria bacterium]|nr:SPOR domain-containing protein [Betaproteobacteria bacterium]